MLVIFFLYFRPNVNRKNQRPYIQTGELPTCPYTYEINFAKYTKLNLHFLSLITAQNYGFESKYWTKLVEVLVKHTFKILIPLISLTPCNLHTAHALTFHTFS